MGTSPPRLHFNRDVTIYGQDRMSSEVDWYTVHSNLSVIILLLLITALPVNCQYGAIGNSPPGRVTEASVICSSNSITGQVTFSSPFNGKIYSTRYAHVPDCQYYNRQGETRVTFSVPNYKCGTILQKNSLNIISHIENEIYVQFDKETQNVEDRKFLFICDRADLTPIYTPAVPYRATIQPGQNIVVQTMGPTQISAIGPATGAGSYGGTGVNTQQPSVWMEIQDGQGPGGPNVQRPLHLGDQVTLVVTRKSSSSGNQYDVSVESCFASDGSGQNRIQLTDDNGCTLKPTIAGKMMRTKNSSDTIYYLPLKAFKFPNTDDVYFSCTVEICNTCNFPEPCTNGQHVARESNRTRRNAHSLNENNTAESIQVHEYVKIMDTIEALGRNTEHSAGDLNSSGCFDRSVLVALLTIIAALLVALIFSSFYIILLLRRRRKL